MSKRFIVGRTNRLEVTDVQPINGATKDQAYFNLAVNFGFRIVKGVLQDFKPFNPENDEDVILARHFPDDVVTQKVVATWDEEIALLSSQLEAAHKSKQKFLMRVAKEAKRVTVRDIAPPTRVSTEGKRS